MDDIDDLLDALDGQFTWDDAVTRGISRYTIEVAVRAGRIARVGRCAYIGARGLEARERHRRRAIALLRARPGRVATHHSAAILLGLPNNGADETVHLGSQTTSGRNGRSWALHRLPPDAALTTVGALGTTVGTVTPAVAAVQCAMLSGVRSGLVTIDALLHAAAERSGNEHGRAVTDLDEALAAYRHSPHVARARAAVALADGRHESPAESLAAYELSALGIPVTPQWEVRVPGRQLRENFARSRGRGTEADRTLRADFRVDGSRVLLEVDGFGKYDDPAEKQREETREQLLRIAGYDVVRITYRDLGNRPKIRALVTAALHRDGHRDPSPP